MYEKIIVVVMCVMLSLSGCSNAPKHTSNNTNTRKQLEVKTKLSSEQEEVLGFANEALKVFIEADYQDLDYDGNNGSEIFSIGFRNSYLDRVELRFKQVKGKKIKRRIKGSIPLSIEVEKSHAKVTGTVEVLTTENGITSVRNSCYNMTLEREGFLWFTGTIKLEPTLNIM